MKLIANKEIDKTKWDEVIAGSDHPFLYAFSWYLDIVHPQWQALVDEEYKLLFPVPSKRKKGIHYVIKPFFTQQLGWFGKSSLKKEMDTIALLENNFKYVDFSIHNKSNAIKGKWNEKENANYELHLNPSYASLTKKYNENCKRNLKKSGKSGHRFSENISMAELIKLFKQTKGTELKEMSKEHYRIINEIYASANENKAAFINGIKNSNGKLISAVLFIHWQNRIYHLFSATSEEGKKTGAAFAIIDECIKKYCGKKIILDFEGSNIAGLARFYSGFGAERKNYFSIKYNNLPFYLKWLKK